MKRNKDEDGERERRVTNAGHRRKSEVPALNYLEIGENIRRFREATKLTQSELAERVGIGNQHASHVEGGAALSLPVLVGISNCLGVSSDAILGSNLQVNRAERTRPETPALAKEMIVAKFVQEINRLKAKDAQIMLQIILDIARTLFGE